MEVRDIASLVSVVVSSVTLLVTIQVQQRIKTMDVTADFQRRYENIWYEILEKVKSGSGYSPEQWYKRFWWLQADQFEAYLSGFVTEYTFRRWMKERNICWQENAALGATSYQDGWKNFGAELGQDFNDFIGLIHGGYFAQAMELANGEKKRRTTFLQLVFPTAGKW